MKILVVNGPNLNLLGTREPEIYGTVSMEELKGMIAGRALQIGAEVEFFQSNQEGEIIDFIHRYRDADGMIINPAALTHTSFAIRDAISAVDMTAVEVHLSNIHSREEFRRISLIAPVCIGQISGFGIGSYFLGLEALVNHLGKGNTPGVGNV
ncbi:MAG: type II 3-dehydroquinate dehydratase [Chrysiogenales bacterium]|nr:MAG: type II 3-dehydroquinate dehydratase [Chrysiogenales bacterium]